MSKAAVVAIEREGVVCSTLAEVRARSKYYIETGMVNPYEIAEQILENDLTDNADLIAEIM